MTAEEWFCYFFEKYGEDFNWYMIPFSNHYFIDELLSELGQDRESNSVYSIAKCESNDNVLFLVDDVFRIYHLTYSKDNASGFPRYLEFGDLTSAMNHIEKEYVDEYM